jgi:phosphoenolpyruvate synthase/pyruvate phosphate dikinase
LDLKNKFPRTRDAKIKEKVLVGHQIRQLIQDVKFEDQLSEMAKEAWKSLKNVATNFGGGKSHGRKLSCYGG